MASTAVQNSKLADANKNGLRSSGCQLATPFGVGEGRTLSVVRDMRGNRSDHIMTINIASGLRVRNDQTLQEKHLQNFW